MQKITLSILFVFGLLCSQAQIVKVTPENPSLNDEIEIFFDASQGTQGLVGTTNVYMHSGVVIDQPNGTAWEYVKGNWGEDDGLGKMTKVAGQDDLWSIKISNIAAYYGVPAGINIFRLSMVFRNANGSSEGKGNPGDFNGGSVASNGDIYIDIAVNNYVQILAPTEPSLYLKDGEPVSFRADASTEATKLSLYLDQGKGFELLSSVNNSQTIDFDYTPKVTQKASLLAEAIFEADTQNISKEYQFVIQKTISTVELPLGLKKGINYTEDQSKVTLVLEAPQKDFVYVVGDFTNWEVKDEFLMNQTPDGELFWLEIENLTPSKEYVFQYWVDGDIKIGDPYADKVADPWNDNYIPQDVYPNLPSYQRTDFGIATVLKTGQKAFDWGQSENAWQKPEKENLIIYELLVRDFLGSHSYKDLADTLSYLKTLGVNAIELMPIMEFEGNESWGYNPSYFFAPDKYYGSKDDLKNFIQKAHEEGFAVILDMVLNHAYGQNAMVKMYWDAANSRPAADSPWFNQEPKHPFNVGYDFNHESSYTQSFVDDVNAYWLNEFHFDGFRFDLSKGFTQTNNPDNIDKWGQKDDSRIAILKRMASKIWEQKEDAYVILEHFAANNEEDELQASGMLTWGNYTHTYGDLLTGKATTDISGVADLGKVAYMESHDEERLIYKADNSTLKTTTYDTNNELIALNRDKMLAAFFFTLPGPKMMWQFQELGYDVAIDFNGRVGNKPQAWGEGGLGYYEQKERRDLYKAYAAIINLVQNNRATFSEGTVKSSLNQAVKSISFEAEEMDAFIVGNFDINAQSKEIAFPKKGKWFDYFSGDSLNLSTEKHVFDLSPGEFHIYTSVKLEELEGGLVTTFEPIVFTEPESFSAGTDVTLNLRANLAESEGDFKDLDQIFLAAGVVTDSPNSVDLKYLKIDPSPENEFTLSSTEENIWQLSLNPRAYFGVPEQEEIYKIGLYLKSKDTLTQGFGYGKELIWLNLKSEAEVVKINPKEFYKGTPITITFDAAAANGSGTAGLVGAKKVYMHAGIITASLFDENWEYTKGNWGQDDGIGQMTKVSGSDTKWQITLTPNKYFSGVPASATWYRIGMVFRNEDGSLEGKSKTGGDIFMDFALSEEVVLATESRQNILVYPNPSEGVLKVQSSEKLKGANLFNMKGEKLRTFENVKYLNTEGLNSGTYILQILTEKGTHSKRIFIR
ncbi:alpha-amylase family glycosyl hydrolase [Arcticibacterium luteifluviistationis]|uniref:Alpha-amylase n=1 Tax=Arcticibacterium luteifluviistationis TaxID=1784714 RepID=A0A2Z4GF25_9BACT|nr:alpha-amylase family glycosyl hydrolase [Arcticibacterium luteifluviistationis]AWV99393.1 alpha-amylase [Arcticibacterium luteifluviistationis]